MNNTDNQSISEASKNVLSVYRTYFPDPQGGIQEVIRQICLSTSQHGVKNKIFTLSPNPYPSIIKRPEGVVIREKSWLSPASCDMGSFSSISTFRKLSQETNIIHHHFPWPYADILHHLVKPKVPSVMTYHSDIVRQRALGIAYAPIMWSMLKKMDIIVATSPNYALTSPVISHQSIQDKVKIIPLGIDENTYPKIGDDSVFSRIRVNINEPYFLFLGVLRYYKGIHILISAAKSINAKVVIAGSGPESEKLKKQVKSLGLKNIFFAGQVTNEEKISLIKNCTALVLSSHLRSEAFGMVLVEASMMCKPMISCEIGTGTSYVNLHEETGLVVQPENIDEMHEAMQTILNDASLAKTFGENSRRRYELLFSGPALGQAYKSVYADLIK